MLLQLALLQPCSLTPLACSRGHIQSTWHLNSLNKLTYMHTVLLGAWTGSEILNVIVYLNDGNSISNITITKLYWSQKEHYSFTCWARSQKRNPHKSGNVSVCRNLDNHVTAYRCEVKRQLNWISNLRRMLICVYLRHLRHVITSSDRFTVYLQVFTFPEMCLYYHIRGTRDKLPFRAQASIVTLTCNPKDTFSVSKCGSCNSPDSHRHQPTDWLTPRREWRLNHNVTLPAAKRALSILPLPVLRRELADSENVNQKWRFTHTHT